MINISIKDYHDDDDNWLGIWSLNMELEPPHKRPKSMFFYIKTRLLGKICISFQNFFTDLWLQMASVDFGAKSGFWGKINIIIFLMKALLKMSGIYKVVPWRVNLVAAAAAKKWTLALFVIQRGCRRQPR